MNIVCSDEIKVLTEKRKGMHVSIFMPTHPNTGGASKEDVIRFKNLVNKAEDKLVERGLRSPEAKELLSPAEKFFEDNLFWRQQSDGLALFLAPKYFLYYNVPLAFEELMVVNERFHVKPFFPLLGGCGIFYILALSQHEVKLMQATRYGSAEMALPAGIPRSLPEAQKNVVTPGKQVRYHSGGTSSAGAQTAIFHGAGLPPNYDKDVLLHFFEQVNKGVYQLIGKEKAPLVLSGVEYLLPLYRQANTYQHLLSEGVTGNPEGLSNAQIKDKAWKLVQPQVKKVEDDALAQYRASAGTGTTSSDVKEVILAAIAGRVRFLFVSSGTQQWGSFNSKSSDVILRDKPEPGDEDLLDLAAFRTLTGNGSTFVLEPKAMPEGAKLAAVFRY